MLFGLVFLVQNRRISRNTGKLQTQGWCKFHVSTHPKLLIWYDYYTFLNSWDNRLSEILHWSLPPRTVLEQYKLLWFEKWKNTPCSRHFEFFGHLERYPEFGSRVEFYIRYTTNVPTLVFLTHLRDELQTCKLRTLKKSENRRPSWICKLGSPAQLSKSTTCHTLCKRHHLTNLAWL